MNLSEKYNKEILPELKKRLDLKNDLEAPRLEKVVLNVGFGRHAKEKAYIDAVKDALQRISGQAPVVTKAKKSISSFKIREGMPVGARVTLRGRRMYDFVEKLVNVTYPRVRDFRGIEEKGIDRNGNMTLGFKEHLPFPEIRADEIDTIFGLEISLTVNTKKREQGLELFRLLGFPFKKA